MMGRTIPELNWSLSREDSPLKQSPRQDNDQEEPQQSPTKKFGASKSTSRLPDPKSGKFSAVLW